MILPLYVHNGAFQARKKLHKLYRYMNIVEQVQKKSTNTKIPNRD